MRPALFRWASKQLVGLAAAQPPTPEVRGCGVANDGHCLGHKNNLPGKGDDHHYQDVVDDEQQDESSSLSSSS